jgi:ACR3 family arsenite efflux pump ArsB
VRVLIALLFTGAILAGSLLGVAGVELPTDPLILVLVGAVFFTLRFDGLSSLRHTPRTILVALATNVVLIPFVAVPVSLLLPDEALRLGVLIYCLAPCTDWFLGFTRLAGGDTTSGAALIPLQMLIQLLMYPVWMMLFAGESVDWAPGMAGATLLQWFLVPAGAGLAARLLIPRRWRGRILTAVDTGVPFVIAAVIAAVFAGNVTTLLADPGSFLWVLLAVFVFFVATFALGEGIARLFVLDHPAHALVVMTTSARNAPLMLALTAIAMLVEFPHLTILTHLLRGRAARHVLAA